MKNYPSNKQTSYTIVTSDTLQENVSSYVNELNGKLDSENMPINSLDRDKFSVPTTATITSSTYEEQEWVGETQAYYNKKRTSLWLEEEQATGNIWTPVVSIDLINDAWSKGWNDIRDYTNMSPMALDFDAKEGMLNGCVNIDFHHGANVVASGEEPVLYFTTGEGWWTRWGVFVNGVLVSDSGKCYPRAENLVLPFCIPVGSQKIEITIKWMSITTNALDVTGYEQDPTTDLDIYGVSVWARNTWR